MKKKITPEILIKDYEKLKKKSQKYYSENKMKDSLDSIFILAKLMYNFNLKYTDDDMEKLLKQISNSIFGKTSKDFSKKIEEKKVIFYDYFALDNRGLTEQYLQGLIDLEYEILFITLQKNEKKMKNILKKLLSYKGSEVYVIKALDKIEICQEIREKAISYNPSKIFIHTSPWDTVGFVTWASFEDRAERYLINLSDHTFWLGKCCSDYFIEFRSYGKNISIDYRRISEEKISILPYYPIRNLNEVFQGFSFDTEGKKIIFSGGSLYKIYGSSIYFELVKYILDNHEDTIFLFLGNGDEKPLRKFIFDNKYESRFYFYNERRDINEVFKRCYFYLGTYPITGGLMSQFAVANGKLPVAYTSKELSINLIEELFINCDKIKMTFTDLKELKNHIDKLLKSKEYLLERISEVNELIITEKEFAIEFKKIIETKKSRFNFKKYEVDIDAFSRIYFEQENKFLHQYKRIFLIKNIKLIINFFEYLFPAIIEYVLSKIKNQIYVKK
ncbi:MAG: hypothetical protein RR864_05280 [Cetobacterium sp.]